ncbi:hypothetical protein L5515_016715 [Caenorhabditis briggsae]|uniref:JmjC domain-containing protein n=1 Tax=Caenorhabditis briggsae TaxID=6238 RepID=A0AAE9JP22_CAEBR|nr:hypothetical protein L5515_016715 [Caenorhabditis briggsae]
MSGTSNNADPLPKVVVSPVVDEKRKKSVGKEMKEIAKSLVKNEKGITVLMSYRKKIYSEEQKEDELFEYFSTTISESLGKFFSVVKKDVNEAIKTIRSAGERIENLLEMLGNIPQNASKQMNMFKKVADEMKVLAQLLEKEMEEADHFIWKDFNNDDGDDDDDEDSHNSEPNPKKFKANDGSVHQSGGNQPRSSRKLATDRSADRAGDGMEDDGETLGNAREPKQHEDEDEGEDEEDQGIEEIEEEEDKGDEQSKNIKGQPKQKGEHQQLQVIGNGKGIEQLEENQITQNALGQGVDQPEGQKQAEREHEEDEEDNGKEEEEQQQPKVKENGKGIEQLEEYEVVPHPQEKIEVIEPEEHEELEPAETEQGGNDQMLVDQPQSSNDGQEFGYDDQPGRTFDQPEFVKKESVLYQVKDKISKNLDGWRKETRRKITQQQKQDANEKIKAWKNRKDQMAAVEQFIIMSVGGAFMSLHCDMGGTWVYYHVKQGRKVFFIALGTPENLEIYTDWMAARRPQSWILKELKSELRRVEVRAGESVVLPAGCLHLVYTPEDSLVYAGNYLTTDLQSMEISFKMRNFEGYCLRKRIIGLGSMMAHYWDSWFFYGENLVTKERNDENARIATVIVKNLKDRVRTVEGDFYTGQEKGEILNSMIQAFDLNENLLAIEESTTAPEPQKPVNEEFDENDVYHTDGSEFEDDEEDEPVGPDVPDNTAADEIQDEKDD